MTNNHQRVDKTTRQTAQPSGLAIADRDSGNIYPIYPPFPCSDFYLKCGGGLGWGIFFLHFMPFPTFLEKIILGISFFFRKTNLFHLVFSLCFFYTLDLFPTFFWKYWKVPDSNSGFFDFIECFTTTFLRAHSWLNWVDEDDDEDEVGLKEKPEDTRYIKKITSK